MNAFGIPSSAWVKSSYSNGTGGNCVEWAPGYAAEAVPVRDSKDPHGPVLMFAPAAWTAFVAAVEAGEFAQGSVGHSMFTGPP